MRKLYFWILSFIAIFAYAYNGNDKTKPCDGTGNCKPIPTRIPQSYLGDQASMLLQLAVDPNELEGPKGVDSLRWVSKNDILSYTVFFENDPEFATASAQEVDIRIKLPHEELLKDFTLGTYTFANRSFEMPNEPNFYSMRLDCRDSLDIYVDVVAGLEAEKQQAFWHFSSIDPESGYAPWQIDRGILPVNDSTHVGEGFVTFRLKPFENMVTGDSISFSANIVFDSNDTIPTNRWCNLIDAGAPTSKVIANVDREDYSHYQLSFEAEDDMGGSGMNRIFLYLADNLGTYEEYAVCPVDSVLDFYVEKGRQYNFMTIGEDRVGNREDIKIKPDLVLNFNEPPTDLILSNTVFQDDIELDGFIGELSSVDTDGETEFTYSLAEGEGAIHNEMFSVAGNRLQANECFKCSDIADYSIRLSTTDAGGLSYSKAFQLHLQRVLEEPEPQTLDIDICEGDEYDFHGEIYSQTGTYIHRVPNEFMCDSVYTLNLRINPIPEPPTISVSGKSTLISSAENGNQWYKNGYPIDDATEKQYTATETGMYYVTASNGRCESNPSEEYFVNLDARAAINIPLNRGWNWISSNIADSSLKEPNKFFESALSSISTVRGSNGDLIHNEGSLSGDINSIEPATYKVSSSNVAEISLAGELVDVDNYQYFLNPGWNWIPYIPTINMTVENAFSSFTPTENDVIKGHTQFAVFENGNWSGSLKVLSPNSGYMYYSREPATLKYSSSLVSIVDNQPPGVYENPSPWDYDESDFADNMTIIAELRKGDSPTVEGVYTVGAFCNNECRGIGEYVDGKLFITIHGNPNDAITFKAFENATDNEKKINEELTFTEQPLGSLSTPYILSLGGAPSGIDEISSSAYDLNIYPNPVRNIMYIDGDVSDVIGVKVITISGIIVLSTDTVDNGVNVSSIPDDVYVAAIVTDKGVIYRKFVKKAY